MSEDQSSKQKKILTQHQSQGETFYLPCFLSLQIQNINQIMLQKLIGQIKGILTFRVYYGKIDSKAIKELCKKIAMHFELRSSILLSSQNDEVEYQNNTDERYFTFILSQIFDVRIEGDLFWSPFQELRLILTLNIPGVTLTEHQSGIGRTVIFRFNFLDNEIKQNVIRTQITLKCDYYELINDSLQVDFNNHSHGFLKQSQIVKMKESKSFSFAHFKICCFKQPYAPLFILFSTIFLLGIINIMIFFQQSLLDNRLQTFVNLLIAFSALFPVIKKQIPPGIQIVFVQYIIIFHFIALVLALIESLQISINDIPVVTNSTLYNAVFFINVFTFVAIGLLTFIHFFFWARKYRTKKQKHFNTEFIKEQWYNQNCNNYFKLLNEVKIYENKSFSKFQGQ